MIVLDFYGGRQPEVDADKAMIVTDNWAGPSDAEYEARVVAAREYKINLTPVVVDESGALVAWPLVQIAHASPSPSDRNRNFGSGIAEHFTTSEASTNGIQLGGGSKIGPDGPVNVIWVHGTMPDGGRIRSPKVRCGIYSTDIVLSPVFEIVKRAGTVVPPVVPPSVPFGATIRELAQEIQTRADQIERLAA